MGISESKGGRPARNGDKPFTEIFRQLIQGETQQTAADKIGVSRQNIGKWLSGSTTPDIETLCRIADAYNVTTDYLLGRTLCKSSEPQLQDVCNYLGLSEKATAKIKNFTSISSIAKLSANRLFELDEFEQLVAAICVIDLYSSIIWDQATVICSKKRLGEKYDDIFKKAVENEELLSRNFSAATSFLTDIRINLEKPTVKTLEKEVYEIRHEIEKTDMKKTADILEAIFDEMNSREDGDPNG